MVAPIALLLGHFIDLICMCLLGLPKAQAWFEADDGRERRMGAELYSRVGL